MAEVHIALLVSAAISARIARSVEHYRKANEGPGPGKAQVALARKLSVILHSVWRSGEPFR